jgi:S-DNA-T family DNA segregation ATPase FtsK/SpoIIIE
MGTATSSLRRRGTARRNETRFRLLPQEWSEAARRRLRQCAGVALVGVALALIFALASYHRADPSWNHATDAVPRNVFGRPGAYFADWTLQYLGLAALLPLAALFFWGVRLSLGRPLGASPWRMLLLPLLIVFGGVFLAGALPTGTWPTEAGAGGIYGHVLFIGAGQAAERIAVPAADWVITGLAAICLALTLIPLLGLGRAGWGMVFRFVGRAGRATGWALAALAARIAAAFRRDGGDTSGRRFGFGGGGRGRAAPLVDRPIPPPRADDDLPPISPLADSAEESAETPVLKPRPEKLVAAAPKKTAKGRLAEERRQARLELEPGDFNLPPIGLLQAPPKRKEAQLDEVALEQNARYLETVLDDFGVKGRVVKVRPGPVVTLYELEPAPGVKSSRVVNLADDIARSMSAVSARVAVIPGRNVIGIELPNASRETVILSELINAETYERSAAALPLVLGKDIGGAPVIADLARMPHLLIAGTTGSGKSVGINTMILSLLYRLPPDKCKFIMVDPKVLELRVYDGIPHLLAPVVTEPKKAIVALRWVVKEMERRYVAMSKLGVRNLDGFNQRIDTLKARGENPTERVQTGLDPEGKPIIEERPLPLDPMPLIVVIIDEMADLMMVAGKDIEAAVQRLAQMARAAGIHLIMATQRPSVDVITGTIKANFPTRVSFQVTSKIDSRTILGEQGAEQLLGQGDMLYMAGGGRITRVHGPFVSESEVESVVRHLKSQAEPTYIEQITKDDEEEAGFALDGEEGGEDDGLYRQAVDIVVREGKASTSFIQRRLQIGYNRAARLIERMEAEGIVSPANHAGKREILGRPG